MTNETDRRTAEEDWDEFWGPLIYNAAMDVVATNPDTKRTIKSATTVGTLVTMDVEVFAQIKRELSDWHFAMGQVSRVYSHVSGGQLSKPNYYADGVTMVADEHYAEQAKERVMDAMLDAQEQDDLDSDTVELVLQSMCDDLDITADELVDAGKERARIRHSFEKAAAFMQRPVETVHLPEPTDA